MPQGSPAVPRWFAKVINEGVKGLDRVAAYFDHVIVFDSDPRAPPTCSTCRTFSSACGHTTSTSLAPRLDSAPLLWISRPNDISSWRQAVRRRNGSPHEHAHAYHSDLKQEPSLGAVYIICLSTRSFCAMSRSRYGASTLFSNKEPTSSWHPSWTPLCDIFLLNF